jgi:hypothetical protein
MRTVHSLPVLAFVAVALAGCTYNEDDLKAGQPNLHDAAADLPFAGGDDLLISEDLASGEDLADAGNLADADDVGTPDAEPDAEETMGPDGADAFVSPEITDGQVDKLTDGQADRLPDASPDAGRGDVPDTGGLTVILPEAGTSMPRDLAPDVVTPIDMEGGASDGRIDDAGSDLQVTESGSFDGGQPG